MKFSKYTRTYSRTLKSKEETSHLTRRNIPREYEYACRLCLTKTDDMLDIFSDSDQVISTSMKIKFVLDLEVNAEYQMPTLICENCLRQLNDGYNFKKRCLASDVKLQQYLYLNQHTESNSQIDKYVPAEVTSTKSMCTYEWDNQVPLVSVTLNDVTYTGQYGPAVGSGYNQTYISMSEEDSFDGNFRVFSDEGDVNMANGELSNPLPSFKDEESEVCEFEDTYDLDNIPLQVRLAIDKDVCVEENKEQTVLYVCPKCHNVSSTKLEFRNHRRACLSTVQCHFCSKKFSSQSLLNRHIRVHTGEKPFKCDVCDNSFSQKEILMRHLAQVHCTEKPFKCSDCGKGFALGILLTTHRKTAHSGGKSAYKCKECPKKFRHASGLSRHQNTHKGVKYECKFCSRKFTDNSSVRRHLKYTPCRMKIDFSVIETEKQIGL